MVQVHPDPSVDERLYRSSATFLETLASLTVLEREKQTLAASDPRRAGLVRYIDEVTIGLLLRSQHEMRLLAEAAGPPSHDPRPAHIARTDWQDAERQLREAVRMLRRLALACDGYNEGPG
jgi:hypothetical protein